MQSQRIPERPLLKPWYRCAATDDMLVLEHAQSAVLVEGEGAAALLESLLPLLDGTRTVPELEAVAGAAAPAALAVLAEQGVLLDGPAPTRNSPADAGALFLAALLDGDSVAELRRQLASARLALAGSGAVAPLLDDLLRALGLEAHPVALAEGAPHADLVVVAPAPHEVPLLTGWNRRALTATQPWLLLSPFNGRFAGIGPLFLPGETCCYACLLERRASNLDYAAQFHALERLPHPSAEPAAVAHSVAGIAATRVLRWLAEADPLQPGVLLALELAPEPRVDAHTVLRMPRCPDCSGSELLPRPLPWFEGPAG